MFSCCRCTNPKKDAKTSKKDKQNNKHILDEEEENSAGGIEKEHQSSSSVEYNKDASNTAPETDVKQEQIVQKEETKKSDELEQRISVDEDNKDVTEEEEDIADGGIGRNNLESAAQSSPSSDGTIGTSVIENHIHSGASETGSSDTKSLPPLPASTSDSADDESPNSLPKNNRLQNDETSPGTNSDGGLKSCLSRRSSSKSSIRKKVNINCSKEIIPNSDRHSIDDDEVFSDSIPPKSRANMCAPYIAQKGAVPGHYGLPDWFSEERYNDTEVGGTFEPPVTPVGRDELELKRHRLYSALLVAAQAAVDHRVRFDPMGPDIANEDCDPDLRPSISHDLESLLNRLEHLVERLERSLSARELAIANQAFDSVVQTKRESFDLESTDLPPIPPVIAAEVNNAAKSPTSNSNSLDQRIERIENSLGKLNDSYKRESLSEANQPGHIDIDGSLENIPTVLEEYLCDEEIVPQQPPDNMSLYGYQDIVNGPLSQFLALSQKIGGDVAKQAELVRLAFNAQLQYVTLASQHAQPQPNKQMELLQPTSNQISAIQDFREKNRVSPFFNHLSAISESIPALGWVCVTPTPGPHVKEMNDAGQFYTNRVLKDWKEKDTTHVEWARSWVQTLTELQQYIRQHHTTGLVWSGKSAVSSGGAPPPPPSAAGCPPPPPPPVVDFASMGLNSDCSADERSALFAEINRGEGVTAHLKKVTADMQTHKNTALRTGPAPFKAPQSYPTTGNSKPAAPIKKEPVFNRDGKKWTIEYHESNPSLLVDNTEMNNVVYVYKCNNSTLTVKGKINSVVMDSCKKCSLLFDSVVASIEFVNCQSVQMQVLGTVPTISIDKTDGCQMYLSNDSLGVEIVSSKSSEMNVLLPKENGEFTEQAIPEQFKTTIQGKTLKTICVESLG